MKFLTFIGLATVVLLSGCGKKDYAFYKENIGEAEVRLKLCEQAAIDAVKTLNQDKLDELRKDEECLAADQAKKDHKKELAEQRAAERREIAAERKKQFDTAVENLLVKFEALELKELESLHTTCKSYNRDQRPECFAKDTIVKRKIEALKQSLSDQYQGEALETYSAKMCAGIDYDKNQCDLTKDLLKEQRASAISAYLDNRDSLKSDFNDCQSHYQGLLDKKKRREASDYLNTWKCSTVGDAAKRIKIRNFRDPIS